MEIKIREARSSDGPRLLELIHELAEFERAPEEVTLTLEQLLQTGFGPDPVWKAFVAECRDLIQGFALYYIRFSTWKGPRIYLEDILVTESMRGKGIGTLLFDRLLQEARERKFNGMVWQVLDWNAPALSFYRKYHPRISADWLTMSLET